MQIKRLVIENFKSIERIELIEPNPFTVFVGPNGSGKSTIFEALEFWNLGRKTSVVLSLFGGSESFLRRQRNTNRLNISIGFENFSLDLVYDEEIISIPITDSTQRISTNQPLDAKIFGITPNEISLENINSLSYIQSVNNFTRLFVGSRLPDRLSLNDNQRLSTSANNLEKVLKRVLSNDILKAEIFEWLELFVPEFKSIDVVANPFDGKETLLWYEQASDKPFTKDLISDGTYNILALLTAVYQSDDKPQFLCIEEPENGLHPQVAGELVDFFRIMCEERGHYIWLNTHSKSMAERVRPEEFVVVDKKNGATQIQQFRKEDFYGMRADEAWLTNSLNGGLAW